VKSLTLILLLVTSLIYTSNSEAQRSDLQSWTLFTATTGIGERKEWLFYLEAQPRIGDDISKLERLLLRPAVGYAFSKEVSVLLGYAWTPTFMNARYEEDFRNEERIWQQILLKDNNFGIDWQHRLRQEQRMIDDASGTSHRTRYLLRGSIPMNDCGNWGMTGYNELFVTWNSLSGGPRAGFDRNRFFFGPYFVQGPARFEIGYLGEYGKRFGGDDRMINALMLALNLSL
jgi:hypothetical protein